MKVTYSAAHREAVKAKGLALVTLDCDGWSVKRSSLTYQFAIAPESMGAFFAAMGELHKKYAVSLKHPGETP